MADSKRYMSKHQRAKYDSDQRKERRQQLKGGLAVAGVAGLAIGGTRGGRKMVRGAFRRKNAISKGIDGGGSTPKPDVRPTDPKGRVMDSLSRELSDRIEGKKGLFTGRTKDVDQAVKDRIIRHVDDDSKDLIPKFGKRKPKKKKDKKIPKKRRIEQEGTVEYSALQVEVLELEAMIDEVLFG